MNKIVYNVKADGFDKSKHLKLMSKIIIIFGVYIDTAKKIFNEILGDGFKEMSYDGFLILEEFFTNLRYDEIKEVTQEEILYGEYEIDPERLKQAKTWYYKQTPEVQSFVDILIRNKEVPDIVEPIDWVKRAAEKYPSESFEYPTDLKDAIIGINGEKKGFILSKQKSIEIYMSRDGMSYEEAIEMLEYNPIRATPYMKNPVIWVDDLPKKIYIK